MTNPIESAMYVASQLFLYPVLIAIALLFVHAFYALGAFAWQAWQRHRGQPGGFELAAARARNPALSLIDLEALATKRLEFARIATRVAPMLGLVATMIPMGPALMALADGQLADVSRNLMVAFSAVILALLAAAISYAVVNVRRRWYAVDLAVIEQGAPVLPPAPAPVHDPVAALAMEGVQ
ncbi:biopolymer transporter ExbD [Diaphorobacter nitroreducens]|uniref:MotA/TolQ/ExbB proton channel family protein n=1 Tax=Diaphorobacter nitroreducens TaxID=164759 RepID=UPI000B59866D|nr:MotA/TolQ/ExbB proton channel family protein [Diaphorobacter nitroreducens]ASI67158.1 biopolymer transporter ExbD [Diaphorobacter nitroreducens]